MTDFLEENNLYAIISLYESHIDYARIMVFFCRSIFDGAESDGCWRQLPGAASGAVSKQHHNGG